MIIGTAGHIDHGKTSLVRALTGVDTDRLPEEKRRGITIDLGFAYTDGELLGYVDVPGHEGLVHTMLAGASGIDCLLLVVAADDGPMPQTAEHVAICDLLGVQRAVVALTKVDAVEPARRLEARAEIAELLAATSFAHAPVFEVCSPTGEGVPALHAHLLGAARGLAPRSAQGGFRLAIDRAFALRGVGLVVTGTAIAGRVREGDVLAITPPGLEARVRGLRVHDAPAQEGRAGQRMALQLAGELERKDLARGQWAVAPELHLPVTRLHCELRALAPMKTGASVHAHAGAADVLGRIALLEGAALEAGCRALAELSLEQPIGALVHDRIVLRDPSAQRTLAGATVLDIFPPARHKRAPQRLAALRLALDPDPAPALLDALEREPAGVDLPRFARARNLRPAGDTWAPADMVFVDVPGGRLGFSARRWRELGERTIELLREEHERAPDMIGVEPDRLRRMLAPALAREAFDHLAQGLQETARLGRTGAWLHLPGHRAMLAPQDEEAWRALKPLLEEAPYGPPRVRDLARARGLEESAVRSLLQRASRAGLVYPVAHDHYFTAQAVAELAERVDGLCEREGAARAASLRDGIGGGRKVAIHILEFLDRVGYTRRVRDEHVRRQPAARREWVVSQSVNG